MRGQTDVALGVNAQALPDMATPKASVPGLALVAAGVTERVADVLGWA